MIAERHLATLKDSGLCETCISTLDDDGLVESVADGLKLWYPGTEFYRIRLDAPPGKQKYTQPSGAGPRLYFAPQYTRWRAGMEPILITEGEKKALALGCRLGARAGAVGIGGVWNWTGGKDRDRRILIEDFNQIDLRGRRVYIVFDSDADTNHQVLVAERELARAITEKGGNVRIAVLPPERKGIDDWIVAWGDNWESELKAILGAARADRDTHRFKAAYDKVYTFEDMVGKRFPLPKFFCGTDEFGLVGQGMVTIVHGATNVGKTYLSTQLVMSIANGIPLLGHPCRKSSVLMLQGELPPGLYAKSRLKPLIATMGMPDVKFYNWSFNLAESSRFKETFTGDAWVGMSELERMLDEHHPQVLCIDPLQSYHNLVETSNDQLRELLKKLKQTAIGRNMGIIVVDHDRKSGGDGTATVRGASAKTDLADTVIGIVRERTDEREFTYLSYDKVRYINRALPARLEIMMRDNMFHLVQ